MKFFVYSAAIITLILQQMAGMAQNAKIDSLKQVLQKVERSERIDVLYELAYEYIGIDDQVTAILFAEEGFKMAKQFSDSLGIVRLGRIKASACRRSERLTEASLIYNEVIPIAERNGFIGDLKSLLNSLGITYTLTANYDKALDCYFKSLVIRESEGNKLEISVALNNIGLIHYKINNIEEALKYFKKSLLLKKEINSTFDLDILLVNIGHCYGMLKKYNEAIASINKGLSICGESCNDKLMVVAQFALGMTRFDMKQFEQAERHLNRSLEISKRAKDNRFQAESLIYLAKIYMNRGGHNAAEKALFEAESISRVYGYNELLLDAYYQFMNLYNKRDDYKRSSIYQAKYIHQKDSVYSENLMRNMAKLQGDFREREHLQTIASQQKIMHLQEHSLQQQRFLNIAIACIAFLLVVISVILYISFKNKKRVNQLLEIRVRERTQALISQQQSLQQAYTDLQVFAQTTAGTIKAPLTTLKGITYLAIKETKDPIALGYFKSFNNTLEELLRRLA